MKSILRITVLLFGLMVATSAAIAGQQAYRLHVDGMSCPFCAYGIEKQLGKVKGVQQVDVDIATGTVTVTMAESATLDEATAQKAVKEAGFSLHGFLQAPSAP